MQKQVYDLIQHETTIDILKNQEVIYSISVDEKSINLQTLYTKMNVDINDEILVREQFKKIDDPKSDSDRIFNNTVDFMNSLLYSITKKLEELRNKRQKSIFD